MDTSELQNAIKNSMDRLNDKLDTTEGLEVVSNNLYY